MIDFLKDIAFGCLAAIILIPLGVWIGLSVIFALLGRDGRKGGNDDSNFDIF